MKALLLAAGLGTRLRPITNSTPKCLVTIKGRPLLELWLEKLMNSKIRSVLINTHYLHDKVEEFIAKSPYKELVSLIHESTLLGTAGTILRNYDLLYGNDVLVAHADNYFMEDLSGLLNAHNERPHYCEMTMMTFVTESPEECGIIHTDKDGVVTDFYEKETPPRGNIANGAVYVFSSKLMNELKMMGEVRDISTEVLPKLLGRIFTYQIQGSFIDIGTISNYTIANT